MMLACECGHEQIVRILFDAGVSTYSTDLGLVLLAIEIACESGQLCIVQVLIGHDSALLDSALAGWTYPETCRILVDRGCSIHAR